MIGRNEAFNAMTAMSIAAVVVSARVTYMGPVLTPGVGSATNRAVETTESRATTMTTPTSSTRVPLRIDPFARRGGGAVPPGPGRGVCRFFESLRLIVALL